MVTRPAITSLARIKAAVLVTSSTMMIANAMSPILAEVARAFPDQPASAVQLIIVLPGLVSLPFSLLSGRLAVLIPRKTIVLFSMLVSMLGGLLPLIIHSNLAALLIASCIVGIGLGLMTPSITALISDHLDGHERGMMMGLQSAFVNGGSMLISILAGLLANVFWPNAYLVFMLFVPLFVAVALLLPQGATVGAGNGHAFSPSKTLVYISLASFSYGVLFTAFSTNVAMYLYATGLGDTSTAGVAASLLAGIGILAGLLFGRIYRVVGNFTLPAAMGLIAAGMFLTFGSATLPMVLAGGLLCGFGGASFGPIGMLMATRSTPPAASAMSIAIFFSAVGSGAFASPFVINGLADLTGDGSAHHRFLVAAVGLLILFAVTLTKELRTRSAQKLAL